MSHDATKTHTAPPVRNRSDALRARRLIGEVARRRTAGESVTDETVLAAHPDLADLLEPELALLRILKRAASHAGDSANGSRAGHDDEIRPLLRADAIPGYTLRREIHRGGQGVVYEADQASTGRRVAVKLLHRGPFASPRDRARFQREVALLARLRHPNIVTIHDTGRIKSAHFIVMDLIDGEPLDRFVGQRRSERWLQGELRDLLTLFGAVCDAVHAAHLRGAIHRDLKPGNILVDRRGVPHILDFGLAKDTSELDSGVTDDGQFIGSLPWASPEQVCGSAGLDLRSDVYSLGVVLYQLVTGSFPYRVSGPAAEVIDAISRQVPPRPGAARPEIDRDLETIILTCLAKNAERRYQSAAALAADLRHYLAGDAIDARRDSTSYVVRKAIERHRGALALAVAAFGLLAGFGFYYFAQARQNHALAERERAARVSAEAARADAESQRAAAQRAQAEEEAQRLVSERQADRARSVTAFLVETLGLANPDVSQSASTTMLSFLEAAESQIASRFAGQPEEAAAVRAVIGQAYATLGELEKARDQLAAALDLHDTLKSPPETVYPLLVPYVQVLEDASDPQWRSRWWRLYRMFPALIGGEDAEFSARVNDLAGLMGEQFSASTVEPIYSDVRQRASAAYGEDDPRWLILAEFLCQAGGNVALKQNPAEASRFLTDALEIQRRHLPETHSRVVRTLGTVMTLLLADGRYSEAEEVARQSLGALEKLLPSEHWMIAVYRAREGACLSALGRSAEAEAALLIGIDKVASNPGADGYAREICGYLADHYERCGEPEPAATWRTRLLERVAASRQELIPHNLRAAFGPGCPSFSDSLLELRQAASQSDADLRAPIDAVLDGCPSPADPAVHAAIVAEALWVAGKARYDRGGRFDASAIRAFEESIHCLRRSRGLHPVKAARALFWYGYGLDRKGSLAEAELHLREALQLTPQESGLAMCIRSVLGDSLVRQDRIAEGEPLLIESHRALRVQSGPQNSNTAAALHLVLSHFEVQGDWTRFLELTVQDLNDLLARSDARISLLDLAAWRIVRHADFPAYAYALALDAAQRTVSAEPDSPAHLRTLGAALYRVGDTAKAIEVLERSDTLYAASTEGRQPLVLALLTLTHAATGDFEAAGESHRIGGELMKERRNNSAANREWRRRAATAIGISEHAAP